MAQRTITTMIDDLDGESEATETVTFSLDGTDYEIDLTEQHASELRDALLGYVEVARKAGGRRASGSAGSRGSGRANGRSGDKSGAPSPDAVRAWARENDMKVSERGRISGEVMRAYEAAN